MSYMISIRNLKEWWLLKLVIEGWLQEPHTNVDLWYHIAYVLSYNNLVYYVHTFNVGIRIKRKRKKNGIYIRSIE